MIPGDPTMIHGALTVKLGEGTVFIGGLTVNNA